MAAELVMIGPARPVMHVPYHDLESIFYVLLGISVLYDEPYKPKTEDELSQCFNIYFNTHHPSLQKTFTMQSELGWLFGICEHFSGYFKPLSSLFDTLREQIVLPMTYRNGSFRRRCKQTLITHDEMVKYLINMLCNLPDEAWVAKGRPGTNDEGGGDVLELDVLGLDLPLASCVHDLPGSDSPSENSSETDTPSSPTEPDLHMRRPIPIRPISGPGFNTSSTSSTSARRPCSRSDMDYVDPSSSCVKHLRLNVDTTNANCMNPRQSSTHRLATTVPAALSLPSAGRDL